MRLFSMNWFRNEHKKEMEALQIENQRKQNELLQKQIDAKTESAVGVTQWSPEQALEYMKSAPTEFYKPKLYRKLKLTGDVLTIVLQDGSVVTKPNAGEKDFNEARECKTEEDLLKVAFSKEVKVYKKEKDDDAEKLEVRKAVDGVEILKNNSDFEIVDGSVYLKGIKRSIPALLVNKFAEFTGGILTPKGEEDYEALKKFWLKCCLNPNAKSAEDLYTFLTYHQFKIDKHGNFYAYRRVQNISSGTSELVDFVSNSYNKVKAVWKKKPSDYQVWRKSPFDSGDFLFSKIGTYLNLEGAEGATQYGNLQDLYLDLPNMKENRYTSKHTGLEDYRVGQVISMPRSDGDDNNNMSCSKGFHAASKEYDYSSFGDTPILVIINPMDVLAVPLNEVGKLRTCRWFFAQTLTQEEEHILDDEDFDVSELGDTFEEKCLEGLTEHVSNAFAEEVKRHTFTLPSITGGEIQKIVTSLEEMKEALAKRISVIN